MTCSLPFPERTRRERDGEKRESLSFCSCLLPCLLLAFGLFSILPVNKSFKQFKRYALIKILKTKNYKLDSKRGVKTSDERGGKREEKNQEKGKEKVKRGLS